jgi:AAA15 family ATPase/GTPase
MIRPLARPPKSSGYLMITDVHVENFKCFERLKIENCARVNVIVGDNGAGKTALLEAIFLGLGMTSDLVLRFKAGRGVDGNFRATPPKIEEAIFADYFYNMDRSRTIAVKLQGSGPEARSLRIIRGTSETRIQSNNVDDREAVAAVRFIWTDSAGGEHSVAPTISAKGLQFPDTGEDLSDFFYFSANQTYSAIENAERFSDLRRAKRQQKFVELFKSEYKWIEDLDIELIAGSAAIYASVFGLKDKIAVANISGGINRVMTFLLAIASRQRSVVLVDEMEDGLYYTHHESYWRAMLAFAREYESQLFITTHSKEWLEALLRAAGNDVRDIALLRLERNGKGPELLKFDGADLKAGIEYGAEVRGGSD